MAKRQKCGLAVMAAMLLAVVSAQATSHVRIVRLSYEDGNVQMSRGTGQGLERAILNSPIVEGSSVVTGRDGLAEVEFENNSTVRLGEATDVSFRQLLINDAGEKVNEVELVRGTMYFDTRSGKDNVYRVVATDRTFVVQRNSLVRFMMSGDQVEVAVMNGTAQLANSAEPVKLKKNETLTSDSTNPQGFTMAKGVDSTPIDRWNSERSAYQTVYAYNNTGYGSYGSPGLGSYGFQDLAYYGGFLNLPGYGMVWQPYGASNWLGWNPYLCGAWAFTPGFGYAWASAYPWGWLPYHYGAWGYSSGIGWFWAPGNTMGHGGIATNWQPTAPVIHGPPGYTAPLPPTTTSVGSQSTVLVGRIARTPAYIPGGPVPPDFRSVIGRSSIIGTTGTATGAAGSVARNSKAASLIGSTTTAPAGNTFATPGANSSTAGSSHSTSGSSYNRSGHVFVVPTAPVWTSQGYWTPGGGSATSGQASWAPAHSSGGTSRATGTGGAAHSTPK
jgi:hypothetical protein